MQRVMLAIFAMLAIVASTQHAMAADAEAERGRALAQRLCANCHMNPGQGEKSGPSGIPSFAAVAKRPEQTFDGIVIWLQSIPPMMPNHHLSRDEMEALAAFILSLRTPDAQG